MAMWLSCCKEEKRAVIGFLWSERMKTAEMYCRMLLQYGDSLLVQIKCTIGRNYSEMEERAN